MQKLLIFSLFLLLSIFTVFVRGASNSKFDLKNPIFDDLEENSVLEKLQPLIDHRDEVEAWFLSLNERKSSPRIKLDCNPCKLVVDSVLYLFELGYSQEDIATGLINVCQLTQILADEVCEGVGHNYVPAAYYIMERRPYLSIDDVCGILIQDGGCDFVVNSTLSDWEIAVDTNKPPLTPQPLLPSDLPSVKILQLTDVHLDLNYLEGSNAECGSLLCCISGTPGNDSDSAGAQHWGDYNCDLPEAAMNVIFEDAAQRYDGDYAFVLLTGDYVHHAVWATSPQGNALHNTKVADSLKSLFGNTPIFPVLGNHEPHPCNMYPPPEVWSVPEFDLSWMFDNVADLYSQYLPTDALASFRKAGFYTVSPVKGLRLVVINTNFCYTFNLWLFYNTHDPENQLEWLAATMLEAEKAGESVLIVGHGPPGNADCFGTWSAQFTKIVNRFEAIIKGQFYGHNHEDDLKIYFDTQVDPPRPTGSLNIGASATPYTDLNPGYKVYHFDGGDSERNATWEMMDHETYVYNLTLANLDEDLRPTMFKLYTAREAYGLESLRPEHLYDFVVRMVNDDDLFQTFFKNFNKGSDARGPCDDSKCKMDRLCEVVTSDITDKTNCDNLSALMLTK